jgi:hypothetical protein
LVKFECWLDDTAPTARDPINAIVITFSSNILAANQIFDGNKIFSIIHMASSGRQYERNQQYEIQNISYNGSDMSDIEWYGTLRRLPSVLMTGNIYNVYSDHPKYVERLGSGRGGYYPPPVVTSSDCTPIVAPRRPLERPALSAPQLEITNANTPVAPPITITTPSPTPELKPSPTVVQLPPAAAPSPVVSSTPIEKPAVRSMDVIDFLVDWKGLIGETVTVTGCTVRRQVI